MKYLVIALSLFSLNCLADPPMPKPGDRFDARAFEITASGRLGPSRYQITGRYNPMLFGVMESGNQYGFGEEVVGCVVFVGLETVKVVGGTREGAFLRSCGNQDNLDKIKKYDEQHKQ